jgi:hypothetical protein
MDVELCYKNSHNYTKLTVDDKVIYLPNMPRLKFKKTSELNDEDLKNNDKDKLL